MDRRSYYKNANKPRLLSALGLKYIFVPNIPDYNKFSKNSKNIILFSSINELILKIQKLFSKNKKFEDSLTPFNAKRHNIMVDKKWKCLLYNSNII